MTNRIMYDSINAGAIPASAELIGHYVDGRWATTRADFDQRFPHAAKVGITVALADYRTASVIDVESGALSPLDARTFIVERERIRPGTATVYCDLSTVPYVARACRGHNYRLWLAYWTTSPPHLAAALSLLADRMPDGFPPLVAIQWRNRPGYDESVVFDPKWHPAP